MIATHFHVTAYRHLMKACWIFLVSLFLLSCAAKTEFQITVDAGEHDRLHMPMAATLDLPVTKAKVPVCVTGENGQKTPGQIERIDRQQARVWWVINELKAGASRNYTIDVGEDCMEGRFSWKAAGDMQTNLMFNERAVLQYVHPQFKPNEIERTKKAFHQVYAPSGDRKITKGLGGLYPHHRGIFYGYTEIHLKDQELNTWAAAEGEHQQHQEVLKTWEGPVVGGHTVDIQWNDRQGEPFIEEVRTIRAFRQPNNRLLIEFESTLKTLRGPIRLEGDRQHAGVQFRAAQAVAENQEATRYLRPEKWSDLPADQQINDEKHVDLPWNAIQYPLEGNDYTVAYLTDPKAPNGATFSERLYGRFGEYFPYRLTEEDPLTVRYRWVVYENEDVTRSQIEQYYHQFSHPPTVTVNG